MAGKQDLQWVPGTRTATDIYGYPVTATVLRAQNSECEVHIIFYAGDPAGLFDNAPNGSQIIRTDSGNVKIYIKNGALGAKDGTLVSAAFS